MSSSKQGGVTLVEILIALVILTLVTGALAQGTNYLTRRLVRARNASVARSLSWKRMAQTRLEPPFKGHRSGIFGADFPGFSWSETLQTASTSFSAGIGLLDYKLIVSWRQGWEEDRITLETLLYKHPEVKKETVKNDADKETN